MTLSLAKQWLAAPFVDEVSMDPGHSPADTFARELVQAHEDLEAMRQRYQAAQGQLNTAHHALDMLRARPAPRIFPVHIKCDGRGCHSVVAFDPAPEEARLAAALLALKWGLGESKHWCPGCL